MKKMKYQYLNLQRMLFTKRQRKFQIPQQLDHRVNASHLEDKEIILT